MATPPPKKPDSGEKPKPKATSPAGPPAAKQPPPDAGPLPPMPAPHGGGPAPMDPLAAMLAAPAGPSPLPIGGSLPGPDEMAGADGSPLMQALISAMSPPPGAGVPVLNAPPQGGDPTMGVQGLLQLLALGDAGAGGPMGGVTPGGSGVPMDMSNPGLMVGY
jgi:vasodilator-stimulated phosphoprotein